MKFRKYTFKCTDTNGNYIFDMPMIIPVYSVDEYNSFLSEYNSKYANNDLTIIYGKDSAGKVGDLSDYGSFILNNMGLKYASLPYLTPVANDYAKDWLILLLKQFNNLYDSTSNIHKVPISKTYSDGSSHRDFNLVNKNNEMYSAYFSTEVNKYRPQNLGGYGFPRQRLHGCNYGSGTGSNNKRYSVAELYVYFIVEDNRVGYIDPSGYYDYTPKGLKGSIFVAENAENNSWFKFLLTSDYEDTDPTINDPYKNGGFSDTGGGTGNFDGNSENIEIPGLPTLSAVDTGFVTLLNPSAVELKNLASYLWGDLFDVSTWKKIFADPMDAILGLSIVPVNVPSAGSANVTIGNISTGVSMKKVSSQYVSIDCGTINVNEYWGAYLDYSPYTKAEIYLPFIGTHPVTIDDIMGKPVHVVYHVDVLSGACCAYVQCGGTVLYSFVGQCSCSIPITSNDWTNVINGALSIAGSIGTMVATGGATAPMAVTNIASTAVNSLKPDVEKSGSMGGMGGMLGVQKPYIILTRPRQALPAKQNTFTGYPSFITKTLSECSGYTEVENIHLENVPATQNELDEITELLKSGVII